MSTNKTVATIATLVGGVVLAATSASAALMLPTQSCAYTFSTNMRVGSRSEEVRNLQKVLNMYPQTQVAASGVGSMGMETNYFGPATRNAVNKFQELNAADILTPIGATRGTGNVYSMTRQVLNQVCNGSTSNTGNTNTGTTPVVNGSVMASLTSAQPSQVIVSGQAAAKLADFTFTGNGNVNMVKLMRTGVSNNAILTNVYLYDGAVRLTDSASVSNNGDVIFNSTAGLFSVNGSRTVTVRADIASGLSGQSVGVLLSGYTVAGSQPSTVSLAGNNQPVANVDLATVSLTAQKVTTNTALQAPQTNYPVWSVTAQVGTRAVSFKALTVEMIGSADVSALTNVSLFVNGVKVSSAMADANKRFTFNLASSPVMLDARAHNIEVRADIVSGATRDFRFSLVNVADIYLEDSNVLNAGIAINSGFSTFKTSGIQTIAGTTNSSVNVAKDTSYTSTNVVSGTSNVTIGKFKLTAYGENTKIQSLTINPRLSGAATSTFSNVAIFVDGVQVGSTNNTGSNYTYTLGSSFIAKAGVASIVEVKADLKNRVDGSAINNGYVASVVVTGWEAIGTYSQASSLVTGASNVGQDLTIGGGNSALGKVVSGVSTNATANTSNVKIGSFQIQAGTVEGLNVRGLTLALGGTGATNKVTNIVLKDAATGNMYGSAVGIGQSSQSFTANFNINTGATNRIDVIADLSDLTTGNTIIPTLTVDAYGTVSNQAITFSGSGLGDTIAVTVPTTGVPTLSSKLNSQYVLGGSNRQVGVYNFTSTNGGSTVNDLAFSVTGSGVESLSIDGRVVAPISGVVTFTGLNKFIASGNNGVNVPVTIKYTAAYVGASGQTGVLSGTTALVTLTSMKSTADGQSAVTSSPSVATNQMTLVSTLPTVTKAGSPSTAGVNASIQNDVKIGSIRVAADANGDIMLGTLAYNLSAPAALSNVVLKVGGTQAKDTAGAVHAACTTTACTFTAGYRIERSSSVVFDIYATVAAIASSGTYDATVGAAASFKWSDDVTTNGSALDASLLSSSNYVQ